MLHKEIDQFELPQVSQTIVIKRFNKYLKEVEKNVKAYLVNPTEEMIHDVRTSIRRFDSCIRILPKCLRKGKKLSSVRKHIKSLFRLSGEIRDIDIIAAKFSEYPKDLNAKYSTFLESVQQRRAAKLIKAKEVALSLQNLDRMPFDKQKISKRKLHRRYRKVSNRFLLEAQQLFPIVISDAHARTELHRLRKNCKKLRYTLELADSDSDSDKSKSKGSQKDAINVLEEMQDILGAIHDCDIMLVHIAKSKGGHNARNRANIHSREEFSGLADLEERERAKLYSEFCSKFGNNTFQFPRAVVLR